MKKKILIIDTSVFLSGKPINLDNVNMVTTPAVSTELSPGGRDYRYFQFLQEDVVPEERQEEGLQAVFKNTFPIVDSRENFILDFVEYSLD